MIRIDLPSTPPDIDFPREERREVGCPERRTWVLHEDAKAGLCVGIWECEPGRWRIEFGPQEHEYFIVLSGRCRVHRAEGGHEEFGPGQAVVLPPLFKGSFEVLETMRKHFVIVDPI